MTALFAISEDDLRARALDLDCPRCHAKAGVQCRRVYRTTTGSPRLQAWPKPHDERSTEAWRVELEAMR